MFQTRREMQRRVESLATIPFLERCTPKQLARIDGLGASIEVQPGRTLIREGAAGREFFVTLAGSALAAHAGRRVGAISAGSVMGEMALLDGAPRTATVVASTPMELLVLTNREFRELLEIAPCAAHALARIADQRRSALTAMGVRFAA